MYTEIIQTEEKIKPQDWRLIPLVETVELIRDKALNEARSKFPAHQQKATLSKLLQRPDFLNYFKNSLAQEVAQVIAAHDQQVLALYLFEESANPDAETEEYPAKVDLTIHLLALVTSTSAALGAFLMSLDRALAEVLRELPATVFAARSSILNVIPITQSDVEDGRGYAVLLNSFYAPPLMIWQRD